MALLLLLLVDDPTIAVENTIIHSGREGNVFLSVLATDDMHSPTTNIQLETILKITQSVNLPFQVLTIGNPIHPSLPASSWPGWLAARLGIVLTA